MGILQIFKARSWRNEIKGSCGEWLATKYASCVSDAIVFHDVLIDGATGYTSQIDLLLIGDKGIYVVEVKMYPNAVVYGDGNKTTWYYYNHGKKYDIYSPIKQNQRHVVYLKKLLHEFGEIPCFSVIVIICNDFKVSNVNKGDVKDTVVCNSFPAMKRALEIISNDKPRIWDATTKMHIFDYIQARQYSGSAKRQEHKQQVIEYKKQIKVMENQHICPYCKAPLVLRKGRYGEFYGCPNYPNCHYTQNK